MAKRVASIVRKNAAATEANTAEAVIGAVATVEAEVAAGAAVVAEAAAVVVVEAAAAAVVAAIGIADKRDRR